MPFSGTFLFFFDANQAMKRKLKEETVIFISVIKWVALASITGAAVGVSTTVFVKSLNWGASLDLARRYYLTIPAGLLLSWLVIRYIAPQAEGHGANKVIESVHKESGRIKPVFVPIEFIRTFITLSSGASAGKEGPSAQIGAGLASLLADVLRLSGPDRRKLVVCGISGGFASVFGTPLAGAANTPIAASIMSVELFGPEVAPYAAMSCVISFLITGHRSAYPSQVLAVRKSSSLNVEVGSELEKIRPDYVEREKSLTGAMRRIWRRIWER